MCVPTSPKTAVLATKHGPMSDISCQISTDGLSAFLTVPDEFKELYPATAELNRILFERGILAGVNDAVLKSMSQDRICGRRILVAQGRPPERGTPGRLEMLVDLSMVGKPRMLENGAVDHRELSFAVNVKKGTPLLRRIPPSPGVEGKTVLGRPIAPPPSPEISLPLRSGTELSSVDPDILVAAVEGSVHLNRDGSVEVKTARVIQGDIDYTTGNIDFTGDITIRGTVRCGFSVVCGGVVKVQGGIEDASVKAQEALRIDGGASGAGTGTLESGGILSAHHIENFNVTARGDMHIDESILHCTVDCESKIHARVIVGGTVSAVAGIEAETLGTPSETKTILKAGHSLSLVQQHHLLKNRYTEIAEEHAMIRTDAYYLVCNGMDERGGLGENELIELERLKQVASQKRGELVQIESRMNEIAELLKKLPEPVIKAGHVFPGVVIRFGLEERIVKEEAQRVIIQLDGERIVFRKW